MKMIMSLRAEDAGKVTQSLSPGAIVAPGQLLATLDLKDPSSVQTVKTFSGEYPLQVPEGSGSTTAEIEETLMAQLSGYAISPNMASTSGTSLVQALFSVDADAAIDSTSRLLACFLQNEAHFAGLVGGDETQIIPKFAGESTDLFAQMVAHHALPESLATVAALLRTLRSRIREGDKSINLPDELVAELKQISALPVEGGYGEVALLANGLMEEAERGDALSVSISKRREEIKKILAETPKKDLKVLGQVEDLKHTMTALLSLVAEGNDVSDKALELYLRRLNFAYLLSDFETVKSSGSTWGMMYDFDYPGAGSASKSGCVLVVKSLADLETAWPAEIKNAQSLQVIVANSSLDDSTCGSLLLPIKGKLAEIGCEEAYVTFQSETERPAFAHYKAPSWEEVKLTRNMRPSYEVVLELEGLQTDYEELSVLNTTRRTGLILGTKNGAEGLLVRSVSNDVVAMTDLEQLVYDRFQECMGNVERAMLDPALSKKRAPPGANIFFHITSPVNGCSDQDVKLLRVLVDRAIKKEVLSNAERLVRLNMESVEVKVWVSGQQGAPMTPVRISATADMGWECVALKGISALERGRASEWVDVETGESRKELYTLTPLETKLMKKRSTARRANSTYVFDFLGLFRNSLVQQWVGASGDFDVPDGVFAAKELALQDGELVEVDRPVGENDVGMVAWLCTMKTPEYPEGREMVLIGSDVTVKAGSFGTIEDDVFCKASMLARSKGIPRVYIACNSGARLGAVEELKPLINVAWENPAEPQKGFEYLYITDAAKKDLPPDAVQSHEITVAGETRHVLDAIVGLDMKSIKGGIGVENLQGSGLIAGETSRAYDETFTLSYVTGRSVGIGAYLNRLGQRNIQKVKGPMILTGFDALNKLLGQQVYTTQDQLGGPHIMVPNGVTHELVGNDQSGVDSILGWLSFVPKDVNSAPPLLATNDPVTREVAFMPTKTPYDPRHMLAGARVDGEFLPGFCDEGTFKEYMEGWGKTVVVGRGRVGGLPVGIIAVETRSTERLIPADPASRESRSVVEAQAGQVWFPDSAFKTAQAIRDFNRAENLPLIIFANWRGFSGGTRDMFAEILKYGAMIVDALVEYKHPVTIYIPPNGELRGGAWVVLDPTLNPENMEMYADEEARGGILEPPAASNILWKDQQINDMMHRSDPTLQSLDAKAESGQDVAAEIAAREKLLKPLFSQVAVEFCDLHDKAGRMEKVGAIREALTWKTSRAYLHWRIRRRLAETAVTKKLRASASDLSADKITTFLAELRSEAGVDGDQAVAEWFEANSEFVDRRVAEMEETLAAEEMYKTFNSLSAEKRSEVLRDLDGFARVQSA
jgi:acetyl-CoA carboxylase/biotin carboxylase 1